METKKKQKKGKEFELEQYNVLNCLYSDNARPKSWLELNAAPFSITKQIINKINSTILTKEAISFIENNDNAIPKEVLLIEKDENGCRITEAGCKYWEYYNTNILTQ